MWSFLTRSHSPLSPIYSMHINQKLKSYYNSADWNTVNLLSKCFRLPWVLIFYPQLILQKQIQWCLPGGEGTQWTCSDHIFGRAPAHIFKGHGQRALLIQQVVGHHQRERSWHTKVGQEAHGQWHHDANGNGSLRVLHLFTCHTQTHKLSSRLALMKLNHTVSSQPVMAHL